MIVDSSIPKRTHSTHGQNHAKNNRLSQGAKIGLTTLITTIGTMGLAYLTMQPTSQTSTWWGGNQPSTDYTPLLATGLIGIFTTATYYLTGACRTAEEKGSTNKKEKTNLPLSGPKTYSNHPSNTTESSSTAGASSENDLADQKITEINDIKDEIFKFELKRGANSENKKIIETAFNDPEMKMNLAVACAKNATIFDLKDPYRKIVKKAWKDFKDDLPLAIKFLLECSKIKNEFCMHFFNKNFDFIWTKYQEDLDLGKYDKKAMGLFILFAQEKIELFKEEKNISSTESLYGYLFNSISDFEDDQAEALKLVKIIFDISIHTKDTETLEKLQTYCEEYYYCPELKKMNQSSKVLSKSNAQLIQPFFPDRARYL